MHFEQQHIKKIIQMAHFFLLHLYMIPRLRATT